MRTTLKKLSAMILAFLMVVTMASVLAVSAELKFGARDLGNPESLTLGTSANYTGLATATQSGAFFADSIGVWGYNGITSYAPLSNQNGIDVVVDPTLGLSGGKWINKNIYIDLNAWSNPTASATWAKYGTKTITIGFAASYDGTLTWTAVPTTNNNANKMLQFFTFQVDSSTVQQIQLFKTDLASQITTTSGDNGVWNVYFQECTKAVAGTPATVANNAIGYVPNLYAQEALWLDMFFGTHAYTKFFSYDFNFGGLISYNSKDTTAKVDFPLTAGTVDTTQWDVSAGMYKTVTTNTAGTTLNLTLLAKFLQGANTAAYLKTTAYAVGALNAFGKMTYDSSGYPFTVTISDPRIGTSTLVPSDATVTYAFTGLKGVVRLSWATSNAVSGTQYATAVGGEGTCALVANQGQTLTAAQAEAGTLIFWEDVVAHSLYQPFGSYFPYPLNQNEFEPIVYETVRGAQSDWNFDTKITTVAKEMNLVDAVETAGNVDLQLVPVIGGDNLIAGLSKKDAKNKTLRDYGYTLNYYVDYTNNFMCQMTIDIHDKTLADITTDYGKANFVVKVTKGKLVTDYSYTICQYDETLVIPLQDGTYTLLRIKVKTNFDDKVSPLDPKTITEFNWGRRTLVNQLKLYNDRLANANGVRVYNSNANKVIYVDLINAIPGYGTTYYWNYDKAVGTAKVDGYNGVKYYTKLAALLSYVGFNTDGSQPVQSPVGYSKFYNTIVDSTALTETDFINAGYDKADKGGISLTPQQMYDNSFRMVYVKGTGDAQESVTLIYYPLTPAQTLNYAAPDGNTYVYSMFFHTKYGDMPVAAASLGVAQKTDVKITKAGMYTYAIATTGKDTGSGYSIGACTRTETNGVISITNYWDNTRGMNNAAPQGTSNISNYNKAITTLAVRIPAGATLSLDKTGSGVEAKVVNLEYGTLGLNAPDGLVDAYVTIQYSTVSKTTFTLIVNYDDGPNDSVKGYNGFSRSWDVVTTWVVRTDANPDTSNGDSKAYNAFTSTLGKTLTPAAAVMPSNPAAAQVVSSSPSFVSTVSAPSATSTPAMGNPFYAVAYIITIGASAIGGVSTLVIRKRK